MLPPGERAVTCPGVGGLCLHQERKQLSAQEREACACTGIVSSYVPRRGKPVLAPGERAITCPGEGSLCLYQERETCEQG